MQIHVVRPGETLYGIARQYGVSVTLLGRLNQVPAGGALAVGQTLVVYEPERVHVVRPGETLEGIARREGVSVLSLYQNNYFLGGRSRILPDEELIVALKGEKSGTLGVNGYAYTFIRQEQLRTVLPYITYLTPFTYGVTSQGGLVVPDDGPLLAAAPQYGAQLWMHLSTLTDSGSFNSRLGGALLENETAQKALIDAVAANMAEKGYQGLDVDFESIYAEDAQSYVSFISRLRELAAPMGIPVLVAVAPKSYANQPGLLYEGMDYAGLGRAADLIFLMTYEWGYSYGPPMAISPIRSMRTVIEYALKEIPAEKLLLGIPNYGYDWQIPYSQSRKAVSISNQYAVSLAARYYAAIRFDESVQAPWFRYVDERGQEHEVWFEDARSIRAKLSLVPEYGLRGVGYWNLMRPFPQNWVILNALYHIREGL